MENLMSFFEGFDIENIGSQLPSAESMMEGLPRWMVLLVLIGPLLTLALGIYYLFFAPKEANHSVGYRFFYSMARTEVWQHAQRLSGIVYAGLGSILFIIIGLISLRFGRMAPPDMVWLAVKCLIWEVVLVIVATLAVDILIVILYDVNGEPRKLGGKPVKGKPRNRQRTSAAAVSTQSPRRRTTGTRKK